MSDREKVINEQQCQIEELEERLAIVLDGQPEIVRCKDCKHRPIKPNDYENGFDLEFPDNKCPCQNGDDGWHSWYPEDDWFCADGIRKEAST